MQGIVAIFFFFDVSLRQTYILHIIVGDLYVRPWRERKRERAVPAGVSSEVS